MPITAPSDLANLTLWIEADAIPGATEGANQSTWPEAGTITNANPSDLTEVSAGLGGQWYDDVDCAQPVMRFIGGSGGHLGLYADEGYRATERTFIPTSGGDAPSAVLSADGFTLAALVRLSADCTVTNGMDYFAWDDFRFAVNSNFMAAGIYAFHPTFDPVYQRTGLRPYFRLWDGFADVYYEDFGIYTPGDWLWLVQRWDGTRMDLRAGCQTRTLTLGSFPYEFGSGVMIGWDNTEGNAPNRTGETRLMVAFDRSLTAAELRALRQYAQTKYCLPLCPQRRRPFAQLVRA